MTTIAAAIATIVATIATATNSSNPEERTRSIYCPECDHEWTTTIENVHEEITTCPECNTEAVVRMVSVDRSEEGMAPEHYGEYVTMAAARQAINDTLATEWGDNSIEMHDTPEAGGYYMDDSNDNQWYIDTE